MTSLLIMLSRLWYRLFGSRTLRAYEQSCIDIWRQSLSEESRNVLDAQLKQPHFVQRQAADAKVCFFWFNKPSAPVFKNASPDLHAATILLKSKDTDAEALRAKIFVHRGRFFSLEFPKRPRRYDELHQMNPTTLRAISIETHIQL